MHRRELAYDLNDPGKHVRIYDLGPEPPLGSYTQLVFEEAPATANPMVIEFTVSSININGMVCADSYFTRSLIEI
jgi:hypothetical protein